MKQFKKHFQVSRPLRTMLLQSYSFCFFFAKIWQFSFHTALGFFQVYELLSIQYEYSNVFNSRIFTIYHYFVVNQLFLKMKLLTFMQISAFGFFREQK